jgi:hypothetical protein
MEIIISEVKEAILKGLNEIVAEFDLVTSNSRFSLSVKNKLYTGKLQFTYNLWYDQVQLFPAICIDVKEVNEVWKKFCPNIGYTYWLNLMRLEYWYENRYWDDFSGDDKDKFNITNLDYDISFATSETIRIFRKYGIRYITDYSTPKGVDTLINTNYTADIEPIHSSGRHHHYTVGLIAAKL